MQTVSKAEFARLRNVSRGRVSQWLAAGQIGPEALVGSGRCARIKVRTALAHLRERLDPSQRFGLNGLKTNLAGPSVDGPKVPPLQPGYKDKGGHSPKPCTPAPLSVEQRIKQEKLRQAELTMIRAEERDRLARGVYVLASAVREENGRLATKIFEAFDGALIDFASAFAARYQIPARDALHLLRKEMVRVRDRVSAEYAARAAAEPPDTGRPRAWH